MGVALIAIERYDEAVTALRSAIGLDPDIALFHENLGRALAGTGAFEDATVSLNWAIELEPEGASAYFRLGYVLRNNVDLKEAADALERGLELQRDNASARNDIAWVYAAADDVEVLNPQEALEHAEKAVALLPQAGYLDTLAEAYFADGQFDRAIETETEALALDPGKDFFEQQLAKFE